MAAYGYAAVYEYQDSNGNWIEVDPALNRQNMTHTNTKNLITDAGPADSQNVDSDETFTESFTITFFATREHWAELMGKAQGVKMRWRISPFGRATGDVQFENTFLTTIMEGISDRATTFIVAGRAWDGNVAVPTTI